MKIYDSPRSLWECFLTEQLCLDNLSFIENDEPLGALVFLSWHSVLSSPGHYSAEFTVQPTDALENKLHHQKAWRRSTPVHGGPLDPAAVSGGVPGPPWLDYRPRHLHQHVGRPHWRGSWGGWENCTQTWFHQSRAGEWYQCFIKDLSLVSCESCYVCVCGHNAAWGLKWCSSISFTFLLSSSVALHKRKSDLHKHSPTHILAQSLRPIREVLVDACRIAFPQRLSLFNSLRWRCVSCDWGN